MDLGKLQGTKMVDLFRFLVESRTILSMHLLSSEYERLTCVIEVRETDKPNQIVVDLPNDFKKFAENRTELNLRFNFNGPDKLEYIFSTTGGRYGSQSLILPFPAYVERLQRRRDFRLQTPPGTQMHFQCKNLNGTLDLINISLGGTFGVFKLKGPVKSKQPLLKVRQPIYRISISFIGQSVQERQAIQIEKAEVVRVEKDKATHQHKYAFEFKYMDKGEKQKLVDAIYRLQREYLQRR